MAKRVKKWLFDQDGVLTRKARMVILPLFLLIATGVVIISVLAIAVNPRVKPASQYGVGANGFQAFVEQGGDMGMAKFIVKKDVESTLGKNAKVVGDAMVSKVMNINGNRGQTVTYDFVRADGSKASVYADLMFFKNKSELDSAAVTTNTLQTGDISGHKAYYMHAQTLSSDREYRLLVIDDLKVYKFVLVQPYRDVTISEVSAMAVLKRLAAKANY